MRTPDEVLGQVKARYENNWRDWLVGPPGQQSFVLAPPNAHTIARDVASVQDWLRTWRDWANDHPTALLRTVSRHTVIGDQTIFTHLDLPDVDALVGLAGDLADRWRLASRRHADLADFTVPHERLKPYLARITEIRPDDFGLLVRAARWFSANGRSGLTVRQVPVVGMHTKWLARHRALVLALLNLGADADSHLDEPDDGRLGARELDLLGLRPLPANIDIMLLDPADRRSLCGLRHVRAPLEEIARLPLRPEHVLIVENKQSALPLPDRPGVVVVHSLGNFVDAVTALPWIADAKTWYWGDLDRAGFTLLSRARSRLPSLTSILMDEDTLDQHVSLAVDDPTERVDQADPTLTRTERETLAALTGTTRHLRLEQERIPWDYAIRVLEKVCS